MDRLTRGDFASSIITFLFRIPEYLIKILLNFVKAIRVALNETIGKWLDVSLAQLGKKAIARRNEVQDNTIVFSSMEGEYTCNPKYISEEILRRKLPYNITWVQRGAALWPYPPGINLVTDDTPEYYTAIAKAKVVVHNGHALQKNEVAKGNNQYWLQTWHGSLGLKRLEGAGGDQKFYEKMQKLDQATTDFTITNSTFEEDVFESTYWSGVPALRLGHARNDILFETSKKKKDEVRKKVLSRLRIPDRGQKFFLYAPTHQDQITHKSFGSLNLDELRSTLQNKFGGEWDILIRTHNSNKRMSRSWLTGLPTFCHNASFYPDMQELQTVADVGVTDYSSWVCDYILTRKPSFLFGINLYEYEKNRGFYHKFSDTPFAVATTNQQLLDNIKTFDQKKYEKDIDAFLEMCGSMDDGKASKRIVDKIESLMAS